MLSVIYTVQPTVIEYLRNDKFDRMWKGMFVACVCTCRD
jgi:hypothetical protein